MSATFTLNSIRETKRMFVPTATLLLFLFFVVSCNKDEENPTPVVPISVSPLASDYTTAVATEWQMLHLELIKMTPNIAPPVAARALGYANLALYESIVNGTANKSLKGQLEGFVTLPDYDIAKKYNWGLAANVAQHTLIRELYETASDDNKLKMEELRKKYETLFKANETQEVIERSIRYGADVAAAVWAYAKLDGGHEAYKNLFPADYVLPTGLGKWKPTSSQKIPLLPYWRNTRFFVNENSYENPLRPLPFSYRKESDFFKEALEIYTFNKNLTEEQRNIALFWSDAGGSLTPPGHHMRIAVKLTESKELKLDKAAEVFCKVGLALHDSFVACWKAKYRYNLLRPETYIRETIDKNWTPLVATPPFPEYTSGHSTCSGATAQVLAATFGEQTTFIDDTHEGKYPNREFSSFTDYASEASNSRMYGGIHYRRGCEEGVINGREIAKNVLNLKFK